MNATLPTCLKAFLWGLLGVILPVCAPSQSLTRRFCDVEPAPQTPVRLATTGGCGGGMILFGWDGVGRTPTTLFWHVEGKTEDLGAGQRNALITALRAWANVVNITFREISVADHDRTIDFNFLRGAHSFAEPAEAGDQDCDFDGPNGLLAHAAFPPLAVSACSGTISESFAGNVHFDDDEDWEQDVGDPNSFSLTLVACHEIGHALGLFHANEDCSTDVMRPNINPRQGFVGLSANDIENIRNGYASGVGSVVTLSETGVWVDSGFGGSELGTESQPFDTMAEGVQGVPPFTTDVTLHLHAGNYPETMIVRQAMILRAEKGAVLIGR